MRTETEASAAIQLANALKEGRSRQNGMSQQKLATLARCHTSYIVRLESLRPRGFGHYPLPKLPLAGRMERALKLRHGSLCELVEQARRERKQLRTASRLGKSLGLEPMDYRDLPYAGADPEVLAAVADMVPALIRAVSDPEGQRRLKEVLASYRVQRRF